jgi:hypothetical protein
MNTEFWKSANFWLANLKGRDHSEDLVVEDNFRVDLREIW